MDDKNGGDYFTTMLYSNIVGDNLLIGAKNILYKLNAQELRVTQTLRWSSLEPEIDNCLVKGKTLSECQNYIKVLEQYKVRSIKLQCVGFCKAIKKSIITDSKKR